MVEIERREFLEGAYLRVSFLLFRNKMPLQDSTNTQTRNPGRDVKDVLERRSRDRGEGLSTLTPRVNDNSTLNRVLRESARQSPERQLLRRRLDGLGLRENEVDGDGNCQFRAIADQLYGSPDRYADVRAKIVEHLRSNVPLYSGFVHDIQYDAYIENMGLDGNWGDHLTLIAASNVYGLEIRVYTSYDGNWERVIRPTDDGNIRRAIQLSFYAELHYNSVYPNSEVDTQMRGPQRNVRRNEARAHAEREFKKDEENFFMHHLYEHTPDFGQLSDMLRRTAEANKISPEEMHRIIGQRLNVNNVEQEYERECRSYRHSRNNSESDSEESVSEDEEYERECRSCRVDISNRPLNFTQCLDCWRGGRGGRSNNNFINLK